MPFRMVTPASMRVLALLVSFVYINAMTPQQIEDKRIALALAEDNAVGGAIAMFHSPIQLPPVDYSNLLSFGRPFLNTEVWAHHARIGSAPLAATIVSFENFGTGDPPAIRVMLSDGSDRLVRVNVYDVYTRTENDADEMALLVPEVRTRMDAVDAFEDSIADMQAAAAHDAAIVAAPAPVAPALVEAPGAAVAIARLEATLATYRTNAERLDESLTTMQQARNQAEANAEDAYRELDEAVAAAARAQDAQQHAQDAEQIAQQSQEEVQNELRVLQQQLQDMQDQHQQHAAPDTHNVGMNTEAPVTFSVGMATEAPATHSVGMATDSDMTDEIEAGTPSRASGRARAPSERFTYSVLGASAKDGDVGGRGGGGGCV